MVYQSIRTKDVKHRLGIPFEKRGIFKGRPIIAEDTPIDGGVFIGSNPGDIYNPREAVVVDSKYGLTAELYEKAKRSAENLYGEIKRDKILMATFKTVQKAFPRKNPETLRKLLVENGIKPDQKVTLDFFLENGIGACRHSALAGAYILGKFKEEGYIRGFPSVDRGEELRGAHAWTRYTNSAGEVIILDPHLGYIGPLTLKPWNYLRQEDIE